YHAFSGLHNKKVANLFASHSGVFVKIAKAVGIRAGYAFSALQNEKVAELFESYCNNKASFDSLMLAIKSSNNYAIELGRRLDELHENERERINYLKSLSKTDVLGLLLSDPEFFYTSSNQMLFDRLNQDFKPGELAKYLKDNGIEGTELHRNLIFRAINYDRLYGMKNSIFKKSDMPAVLKSITVPLRDSYDSKYYYLLANSIESFDEGMKTIILKSIIAEQAAMLSKGSTDTKKEKALYFLVNEINKPRSGVVFDDKNYRTEDGKLLVVQIFSNTEEYHWGRTNEWFKKYCGKESEKGKNLEIYETEDARIVLYMGKNEENQNFLRSMLEKTPNMILTFRGHSYSLMDNIPLDIFGNRKGNILFIPGSCGSAGSIPNYMDRNPGTSIQFIANTSTGRGQVTNALVTILLNEALSNKKLNKKRTYIEIIKKDKENCLLVQNNGGDCNTLKVDSLGWQLINYVNTR
ncbi:MAG: hypothetical protein N3G22_04645, partial [Candidatus Micrarchaeota archaeon]|nr:hypothetical protein [Candidatus Micrarchaeota archaeon]